MHFNQYDDDAHIWVYGFNRTFSALEKSAVEAALREFTAGWQSHGKKVSGDFLILHDRFVILAVPQKDFVSGCSIDSSVQVFRELNDSLGLDGLDAGLVFYRKNDTVAAIDRPGFQNLIDRGEIKSDTIVFDSSIQTVGELRAGKFERPLSGSWHAVYFSLSA